MTEETRVQFTDLGLPKVSYRAIKDDIQGDSFTTLDGRRIYVAGVERLEVDSE